MIYASKEFWLGVAERAVKTGAQMVLFLLGVGITAAGVDGETAQVLSAFAVDWIAIGGAFLGGAFLSLMTSLVAPEKVPTTPLPKGKHEA
jgi:hypothetical protein